MHRGNYLNKIAIGTAQFGLNYGISNQHGQTTFEAVCAILKLAANQLDTLDTAMAYGNSETVLGQALKETNTQFKVVTKLSGKEANIAETVAGSLQKLGLEKLYGCLFHNYDNYKEQPRQFEELQKLKESGLISKIGFSLYYPQQAEELLANNIPFDLVQVPFSLFDQRFGTVFKKLKKAGVEIHTRSVFLQGLFFLEPQNTKPFFTEILPSIRAVKLFAEQHKIPLNLLLLGFAALNPDIDKIVVGVENAEQLIQNLGFEKYIPQLEKLYPELQQFALNKEEFLLPFNWKI